MIESKVGKGKLAEAAAEMSEFLESGVNANLTDNEQLALTIKVLGYLADYMRQIGIPVTHNTVVTHMNLLAHSVDICFPYYRDAKLLRFIVSPQKPAERAIHSMQEEMIC